MVQRLDLKAWTRFGRLVLTWNLESRKWKLFDECRCDCGTVKFFSRSRLRNWTCTSCGCYQRECARKLLTKHGMKHTRIYNLYTGIHKRCEQKGNASYKNYWWRGIKCEWKTFEDFYRDMWESYEIHVKEYGEKNTTIDRINPNLNYCKENCRWATNKEQQNNRKNSLHVTYKWKEYPSVKVLCEQLWLNYNRISRRIQYGRDVIQAIETPKYWSWEKWFIKL